MIQPFGRVQWEGISGVRDCIVIVIIVNEVRDLIIIGIELSAQGLGFQVPEPLFNAFMLLALIVALLYQWRFTQPAKESP